MVVSIDIYAVLNVVELILCIAYMVFLFVGKEETYSKVIRLISAFSIVVINAFQMPMEIQMDKSYGWSIFMIILWLVNVVSSSWSLGEDF
ncbi:MAG: hypothetical protein IJH39_10545 [Clostridia bacterium]|nr:hypothetical protein [Clostridia bacterium]